MKKGKAFYILWIVFVLLFMYLPILILAFYSFTDSSMIGAVRKF